jgi:hypothetical protein
MALVHYLHLHIVAVVEEKLLQALSLKVNSLYRCQTLSQFP